MMFNAMRKIMKKVAVLFAAISMLMLAASCQKESPLAEGKVKVNIEVGDFGPGTKAIKTGWEVGDKINIWFGNAYWTVLPQLVLTRTASGWESSEVDEAVLSASGTFKAIYEASNNLFESAASSKYAYYEGTQLSYNTGTYSDFGNIYPIPVACCANGVSYTYDSDTKELSGSISDWKALTKQQVVVTGLSGDPGDYAMTFHNNAYGIDHFYYDACENAFISEGGVCNGLGNAYNWSQGVTNADGTAFHFGSYAFSDASVITSDVSWPFGLYLYDMKNEKMYEATFTVKPKDLISKFIIAYKIPFSKFEEYTDSVDAGETMQKLRDDLVEFAPNVPDNNYGEVKSYQYYSKTAGHNKKVRVLLPPDYDANKKYPVLFVLHGIFGDENSMLDASMGVRKMIANAVGDGKTKDMIVIFPQMYTSPTGEQPSGFAFDQETMRYYDLFERDLLDDLLPWAKEEFSIEEGPENTAITGFSMGGREALYIGTQHTDVFGFVGAACPAPGIVPTQDQFMAHEGTIKNEADFHLKDGNPLPYILLISGGTNDGTVGDYPERYHNILKTNNVDHVWHSITGTGHDGSSVQPHLYNFIRHIFNVE